MKKVVLSIGIMLMSIMCFADGEPEAIFLSGHTINHGDYVIIDTEQVYHFQGLEYDVFNVMYDDVKVNMKIAVNGEKYIAYNDEFTAFYECTKHGFGVRKILFSSPIARDKYDAKEFRQQTILGTKNIDPCVALKLIAVYLPQMRVEYNYLAKK